MLKLRLSSFIIKFFYKGKGEVNMNKLLQSKKRGTAVLLVFIAIVLLLALGVGLLSLGVNSRVYSIRNAEHIQARCAADSGLVKAFFEMNEKLKVKPWDDSILPQATNQILPNCDATFSYTVINDLSSYTITSVGRCGGATTEVYALLGLEGLFDSAILVQDRISLMPNTLVAGYNSADPFDTDFDLKIGTTSTLADRIPLGPGTVVDGDVFVGVGGDPEIVIGPGGTITGKKYSLSIEPVFPTIIPPSLPTTGTGLSATGQTITLGPAESGQYTGIDLSQAGGNPGALEIQGGDVVLHITGDIDMGNGCELIVRPGSSLVIYIDGDISADNSVGFNNEAGNVRDFKLYATGASEQVFSLKAKSSIFGAVYAPNANITLYPSAEMRGAIVGQSVTFKSGAAFYYDEALRENVSANDEGARFIIKRWYEGNPEL